MKSMYSNATVYWTEEEIEKRESLIRLLYQCVKNAWRSTNHAVQFYRVETPILTPAEHLQSHIEQKFELLETSRGYLRPETTAGSLAAFDDMFPMKNQLKKKLPICVWQVGKSFRDEATGDTMRASKLRLREFYQMEFQLFTAEGTKADYLTAALYALTTTWGGQVVEADELPHYSERTLDWELNGLEVAGCSERKDWPGGKLFEVAIGIDRLLCNV